MVTDASLTDVLSAPTMAGLFVAGLSLGAVYYMISFTRRGKTLGGDAGSLGSEEGNARERGHSSAADLNMRRRRDSVVGDEPKPGEKSTEDVTWSTTAGRKRRRKGKGKGKDVGEGEGEGENDGKDEGQVTTGGGASRATVTVPFSRVIPGSFEGAGANEGTSEALPGTSEQNANAKTQVRKTKRQKQKERQGKDQGPLKDKANAEIKEWGPETGKAAHVGGSAVHVNVPRLDESTVAVSASASGGAPRVSASCTRASTKRPLFPQSLSFDTDSSWTHVDSRLKVSTSMHLQAQRADATDATSSDLTSTASESSVAERMENVTPDMHGTRADLAQRTLAERLAPRPRRTAVDDMLEQPDVPTLARAMRLQPPADEKPVPGFSWGDYGDVVEDSLLVHDADQDDEGEWGVVKSRSRTRQPQPTGSTSSSLVPVAPETMTKKQRQNARKREAVKVAKAEAEAARLQGLAKHKRELERLRIIEQSQQGGGKRPSGRMQATVDDRGKLVWE